MVSFAKAVFLWILFFVALNLAVSTCFAIFFNLSESGHHDEAHHVPSKPASLAPSIVIEPPPPPPLPLLRQDIHESLPLGKFDCNLGRFEGGTCRFEHLALRPDGTFYLRAPVEARAAIFQGLVPILHDATMLTRVRISFGLEPVECTAKVDALAFAIPFFYYWGGNNWHQHTDTNMPLFALLEARGWVPSLPVSDTSSARFLNVTHIVMPMVIEKQEEGHREGMLDWDTKAFDDPHKYWMEQMQLLSNAPLLPLHRKPFLENNQTVCFNHIVVGYPLNSERIPGSGVDTLTKGFIPRYVRFVQRRLSLPEPSTPPQSTKIGLIKRNGRRSITNYQELVDACKLDNVELHLIEFGGSFRSQVELAGTYSVIIGVNGAGLMNCLYAPPGSVCVQIGPYGAKNLNFHEFGQHLAARGPYLMWHQTHAENARNHYDGTAYDQSDSHIDPTEFRQLVKDAVARIGEDVELFSV